MHVFVYLFLSTARPTRDCFADHVSAESHCAPSDELSVCPPAAFANERSARQTPPLSPHLFSTVSFNFQPIYQEGSAGRGISPRPAIFNPPHRISVDTNSCQILHLISSLSPYGDLRQTFKQRWMGKGTAFRILNAVRCNSYKPFLW